MSLETDRIEADISESRHRLNDTLEALGNKLSPGQILDEALGLFQGKAGGIAKSAGSAAANFGGKLGRQIQENPIPTLLIATGIAWLALNRGGARHDAQEEGYDERFQLLQDARARTLRNEGESDEAYQERLHHAQAAALGLKQKAGEAMHGFKQRVSDTIHAIEHAGASAGRRMAQTFSSVKHYAGDRSRRLGQTAVGMKHSAEHFYEDNPLVTGALAMAIGAIIGSAAPLSQAERSSLGGVADAVARKGADLAERGAHEVERRVADSMH